MLVVLVVADLSSDQVSSGWDFPARNVCQELKRRFGLLVGHHIVLFEFLQHFIDLLF